MLDQNPFTNTDKKEFVGILTHELRNPLATILSSVELLRIEGVHTKEASELLQTIEERVHFIKRALNHLLDLPHTTPLVSPLPLEEEALTTGRPLHRGGPLGHSEHPCTILIVDDNYIAAQALGKLLQLRGHVTTIVHNGADAIEKAKKLHPHIIVLDIGLPDMSGYEVAIALQKDTSFVPTLIALTGYGQKEDKERALAAGFHLHFVKPVSLEEIETALESVPCAFTP